MTTTETTDNQAADKTFEAAPDQTAPSPQWLAFAQAVNAAAAAHGIQAVALSAAFPTQAGFGPTQVSGAAWLMGPAPMEWRAGVANVLAQAVADAAGKLGAAMAAPEEATA